MKRWVLTGVAVLAVVVVGLEFAAPSWIAARAEAAVRAESSEAIAVEVDVAGPPVLLPLAVTGQVSSWDVRLTEVAGRALPAEVAVGLSGITLDRTRLLRGRVFVETVEEATARIRVDLTGALPAALEPFAAQLAEAGADRLMEALGERFGIREEGGELRLGGSASLPVVDGSCDVAADGLVVTADCILREVPPFLLRAFQQG